MIEDRNKSAEKKRVEKPKHLKIMMFISLIAGVIALTLIIVGLTTEIGFIMVVPGMFCLFVAVACGMYALLPSIQKMMIKNQKYVQEANREDITDLMSTGLGIGIDATSNAIDENEDDLRNIADKGASIMSGPMTTMSRSIARGIKEGARDTKFCKHCGSEIDRDSKFCSECGGQQ